MRLRYSRTYTFRRQTDTHTDTTTHLASLSNSSDVRVEVGRLRVQLHQEHADVVQQGLASVCIPHLGQLPQVTQLKTTGLGILKYWRESRSRSKPHWRQIIKARHSPYSHSESYRWLTLLLEYIWRSGWLRAAPWPTSDGREAQQSPGNRSHTVRGQRHHSCRLDEPSNSCFTFSLARAAHKQGQRGALSGAQSLRGPMMIMLISNDYIYFNKKAHHYLLKQHKWAFYVLLLL